MSVHAIPPHVLPVQNLSLLRHRVPSKRPGAVVVAAYIRAVGSSFAPARVRTPDASVPCRAPFAVRVDRGFGNGDGFAHGSRRAAFVGPFRQRDQLRGSGHRFVTPRSPVRFRAGAFARVWISPRWITLEPRVETALGRRGRGDGDTGSSIKFVTR